MFYLELTRLQRKGYWEEELVMVLFLHSRKGVTKSIWTCLEEKKPAGWHIKNTVLIYPGSGHAKVQ